MVKSLSSGMVNFNSNAIIVEILNFFIILVINKSMQIRGSIPRGRGRVQIW